MEQAQQDLEVALELVKNYENLKAGDQQLIQKAVDELKEKMKPLSAPGSQDQEQFKDALDRLQDDMDS